MIADPEVAPGRQLLRQPQYGVKAEVSRACVILGDSKEDVASIRVDAQPPPAACIRIIKGASRAAMRLSFALPCRLMSLGDEVRLQCRYLLAQGHWAGTSSLLVTDDSGNSAPVAVTGPAQTSTWQGQTTVSANWRVLTEVAAAGHDRLVWAMELGTDAVSCALIDVSIVTGDCWRVYGGAELLGGDAALRDAAATPARDDLAGLIHRFESQYAAWTQARRDLLDEIEYLRRSLDEAHLKQAPPANRGA